MRLTRSSEVPATAIEGRFSGPSAAHDLGRYDDPEGHVLLVSFPAGVHAHWHRHPGGQFLYVTNGRGRVGTRGDAVAELQVGDLVHAPPGEDHWHGAAADEGVTYLAVSLGSTEWLEEVEP